MAITNSQSTNWSVQISSFDLIFFLYNVNIICILLASMSLCIYICIFCICVACLWSTQRDMTRLLACLLACLRYRASNEGEARLCLDCRLNCVWTHINTPLLKMVGGKTDSSRLLQVHLTCISSKAVSCILTSTDTDRKGLESNFT